MNVASAFVVIVIALWLIRTGRISRLYAALTSGTAATAPDLRRGGGASFR